MTDKEALIQIMIQAAGIGEEDPKRVLKRALRVVDVMMEAGLLTPTDIEEKGDTKA